MKKILSLILVLTFMIAGLCSCEQEEQQLSQNDRKNQIINRDDYVCETPTRIIYALDDTLYYYNKLDGGTYVFCFNPICKHKSDCVSKKITFDIWQGLKYREEDNRLYGLRGNVFFLNEL